MRTRLLSSAVAHEVLTTASSGKPVLLSIPEAATVLGCGISSVYGMMREGELNPIHLRGKTKILAPDLAALIMRKRAEKPAPRTLPWDRPDFKVERRRWPRSRALAGADAK